MCFRFPPNCPSMAVSVSSEKDSKPNTLLSLEGKATMIPSVSWVHHLNQLPFEVKHSRYV